MGRLHAGKKSRLKVYVTLLLALSWITILSPERERKKEKGYR